MKGFNSPRAMRCCSVRQVATVCCAALIASPMSGRLVAAADEQSVQVADLSEKEYSVRIKVDIYSYLGRRYPLSSRFVAYIMLVANWRRQGILRRPVHLERHSSHKVQSSILPPHSKLFTPLI